MKTPETIEQTLKVNLTDAELLAIGFKVADLNADIDALEDSMKSVNQEFKMKIAAAEAARSVLSSTMRSKYEFRPVTCSVHLGDPDQSHKTIVRNDTGDIVAVVAMTPDELQQKLDFEADEARHDEVLVALPCAKINADIDAANTATPRAFKAPEKKRKETK